MATDGFEFNSLKFNTENKFGRNTNVTLNTPTDIWDLTTQAIWLAPTGSRRHAVVSDNPGDTAEGTGAKAIRVFGLRDWTGKETSEDIIMDGTTPVNTNRTYVILHRMEVKLWGSSGPNIGTITATAESPDDTISAQMSPTIGASLMAIYGVGARENAFMTGYYGSIQKGIGAAPLSSSLTLLVNSIPQFQTTGFVTRHIQNVTSVGSSHVKHNFNPYVGVPGPCIIKLQGNGTAAGLDISGGFDLILRNKSEESGFTTREI